MSNAPDILTTLGSEARRQNRLEHAKQPFAEPIKRPLLIRLARLNQALFTLRYKTCLLKGLSAATFG
jgi:hypothetical protein